VSTLPGRHTGLRLLSTDAVAAGLPATLQQPADGLAALAQLLEATGGLGPAAELWGDARVDRFLRNFAAKCDDLDPQQVREVLISLARAGHAPPALWHDGLAEAVSHALPELPDLHVVHVALLLASLELRHPAELLREVAEQLEQRAPQLEPTGLTGAIVALSQLGPWPGTEAPGEAVLEELLGTIERLSPRELSATALAVATLGHESSRFWQAAHGALLAKLEDLAPRHVADALLALATTQLCPISLLEGLQGRLPGMVHRMDPDEALVSAWALCAMRLFPTGPLEVLVERACSGRGHELTEMQANQLAQVSFSLELERSASRAREALPVGLWPDLLERRRLGHDRGTDDESAVEELGELLAEAGVGFELDRMVEDFYRADVALMPTPGRPHRCVLVGGQGGGPGVEGPHDPWLVLKRRHLELLEWSVRWLPAWQWRSWTEEERRGFVQELVA